MCKDWKQAGQLVPRLEARMRWGLGHKEVKSGLPPYPDHAVPLELSSVGETLLLYSVLCLRGKSS